MSLDTTNVLFSLIFLNQRKVSRDKALAASVGAGLVGGPVGLILPILVAGGIKKGEPPKQPPVDPADVMVRVPDVVRRTVEAATEIVTKADLHPRPKVFFTNDEEPGIVLQQDPAAGRLVSPGDEVTLVVAHSPEVPDQTEEEKETEILKVANEVLVISKETLEKVEKHVGASSTTPSEPGRQKDFAASSRESLMERWGETATAASTDTKESGKP